MKKNSSLIIFGIVVIVIVVVLVIIQRTADPKRAAASEEFAQCLTAKGVKMYGAYWCPHCQNQKELFGDAFKHVNYIECASKENLEKKTCERDGIQGFPTWVFADGSRYAGELSLDALHEKTQCSLPKTMI